MTMSDKVDLLGDFILERKNTPCKGMFFRYSKNSFVSSHGSIEIRESYRLLKRKSCPGCDMCQQLDEDIANVGMDAIVLPIDPEPGGVYELKFVSNGLNEEGYCDDWWWEMVGRFEEDL